MKSGLMKMGEIEGNMKAVSTILYKINEVEKIIIELIRIYS